MTGRNRWLTAFAVATYAFLFAPIVVLIVVLVQRLAAELRVAGLHARLVPDACSPTRSCSRRCSSRSRSPSSRSSCRPSSARCSASALARRRFRGTAADGDARCSCRWSRPRSSWASACCCSSSGCSTGAAASGSCRSPTSRSASATWRSSCAPGRRAWTRAWRRPPATSGRSALGRLPLRHAAAHLRRPSSAGALLAFALSFDDYVVSTFNAGVGSSTLPLYIYGKVKFGVTPEINAISTIIVAVTAVVDPGRLAVQRPSRRADEGGARRGLVRGRSADRAPRRTGARRRPSRRTSRPSPGAPRRPWRHPVRRPPGCDSRGGEPSSGRGSTPWSTACMIGHCGVVRLPAPLGLGRPAARRPCRARCPRGAAPSMRKTRLQTISPGRLDALDRAAAEPEVDRRLPLADRSRRTRRRGGPAAPRPEISNDPDVVVADTERPSGRRGGSSPGRGRAPSTRGWSRRASHRRTLVDLVEVRDRAVRRTATAPVSRCRTGGRSASLSRPSARSEAGARSLSPCWYWMPIASQPNRSAMRTAAMYSRSWSRTWASVSSVAPSFPKRNVMPRSSSQR